MVVKLCCFVAHICSLNTMPTKLNINKHLHKSTKQPKWGATQFSLDLLFVFCSFLAEILVLFNV